MFITAPLNRSWIRNILAAAVAAAILITRRPDAFLNPQFWAEDGRNWYADAYNYGFIHSVLITEAGYLQTFSRLVAWISQIFPLALAPFFFNVVATAVQVMTALFIASSRTARLVPDQRWRLFLAFLYLAMPHSSEVVTNVTNSQWHVALLTCLILLSEPPSTTLSRIFDIATVVLCSLSGPFCVLLLPIAAIRTMMRPSKHLVVLSGALFVGGLLQAYSLITATREVQSDLGASVSLFFSIFGRHLVAGPLIGANGFRALFGSAFDGPALPVLVSLAGLVLAAYLVYRAGAELRLLALFATVICIAAFAWPAVTLEPGQWRTIAENNTALRYWFVPTFWLYAAAISLARKSSRLAESALAFSVLVLSLIGVLLDWRLPPLKDLDFQRHAREFEQTVPGTVAEIPINPNWKMVLVKK